MLLSQSANAPAVQTIFNQLFSPITYTFKKIIEANIFSQLNIDELAAQHNLSVSSFKREFFKNYKDTPANYIKNKRVEKAAELLIISSQRIKEIAFQCGFNDVANFNKSFKEKYNISPSVYRQSQK